MLCQSLLYSKVSQFYTYNIPFHYDLSQDFQYGSLCYILGSCSLSILNAKGVKKEDKAGLIVITSPHENVIATCYKVAASGKVHGGKSAPQYMLFGVDRGGSNFWGEPTTFLGWYANEEQISKEIAEIHRAILQGKPTYTLQYSAKTQRRWASVKIVEE